MDNKGKGHGKHVHWKSAVIGGIAGALVTLALVVFNVDLSGNPGAPLEYAHETDISALNSALEIHCVYSNLNSAQRAKVTAEDLVDNNLLQTLPTNDYYVYQNVDGIFMAIPKHFHPPASRPAGE